ncbi:plakophilin-2 [Mastacembelus armatus]|uniref:Plakophilin 2 n=1 Tax=Mastacembelus armatus TaxID=205130 RepID=A0A3Q3RZX4_9TELE|nr:plakophilin-2 [Mastacembelus armatus]
MDEVFFKSALPAQGALVLDDTSLALPAEPTQRSSTELGSDKRSSRVYQQVQLTLARKARKSMSNGGIRLERRTKSFDASDRLLPYMKVTGMGYTNNSLSSTHMWRPSRRVEVSPPASPEFPHRRFNYGVQCYGTYTVPGSHQSLRVGSMMTHSVGCDLFQRHAFSEVPQVTQPHASTSLHGSIYQRTPWQTPGPRPVFSNAALQQSGEYGFHCDYNQIGVKQERRTRQEQSDMMLGATELDDCLSCMAQVRGDNRGLYRLNSYPHSVTSVEMDTGKRMEVGAPFQQITTQNVTTLKSENKPEEMTLEKAVNLLTQDNEDTLIFATTHIQNLCLNSTDAKKMVFDLHGIEKLVQLLCSDSEEVQCVAAGALRNVVCQSGKNKMEVKKNDGLAVILGTLKSSHDVETRRQLTGLLWNLSSHDLLKEGLIKEGLPILTQSVLVPCSGLSEGENPKDELLADADVFHFTTGCLRNLSSAGPDGRKAMRECKNLIDSLVYYIRGTIADHKTDDKSTENCVCILHNLSYQFEAEIPKKYTQDRSQSQQNLAPKPKTVGCFAHRSAKITEVLERQSSLLEDKANPCGIEWLWSPITLRMYLSLIACSVRQYTQEAAIGALQNITAGNGAMSEAIAFTLVQQEKNLQHIKYILQEGEGDVKRTALSLIKNLSRYNELQPEIVNQVLPDVVGMLPNDDTGTDLPAEVTASLCHILINLSQANSQNVKAIVKERALLKIINISNKDNGCGPSRAGQAACILLHTIWKHTDLHKDFKKLGYRKTDFINARTNKAVKSR